MADVEVPSPDVPVAPSPSPVGSAEPPEKLDTTKLVDRFRTRIEAAKKNKDRFTPRWRRNITVRIGQPDGATVEAETEDGEAQSIVNPDWSLTKTKTANLYSQVPSVQLTHENTKYADAIPPFAKALNYELGHKRANVGVPMEEVLNDVVNAAGIGAVMVGYMARFETKEVPVEDTFMSPEGPIQVSQVPPEMLPDLAGAGLIHMQPIQQMVDDKFFCKRVSPGDLLWPDEFKGSNFDEGDWIGDTNRSPWPVAKVELRLKQEQKAEACGGANNSTKDDLRVSPDKPPSDDESVTYDTIYYWRYRVDPDEKSFTAIWRLVFVHGIKEPVIHEAWKGQQYDSETRKYIGCQRFPIRVLTLTYISDNPIPPSDTEAGRPQVLDMRRSRSQMFENRDRSRPVRWFDANRIDPLVAALLRKGVWQAFVPTNGDGTRSIGEIARASYPSEDFSFDKQTKSDLMESWQIGPNQQGTTGAGITATESDNVQANFATRVGQDRNHVAQFFLSIAEALAGWMVLYSTFPTLTDEERAKMEQAWDGKRICHDLVLRIRPDSQITLDTAQRVERLTKFLNITGKSGAVNINPVITEIAELTGLDPAVIMKQPEPPPPTEPNISLRLTGKDDLVNPLVMAMLVLLKKAPSIEQITEAQKILDAASVPASPPGQPQPEGGPGAEGLAPPDAPGPPDGQQPPGQPPPGWALMPHVAKRSRDMDT